MNYLKILAGVLLAFFLAYFGNAALYMANVKLSFSTLNNAPFWGVNHSNISMVVIGLIAFSIYYFLTFKTTKD
ncbi:MAG: hypothetical protein ACI92O_000299 [Colwellia sp.]|jgi:hypothetical protein